MVAVLACHAPPPAPASTALITEIMLQRMQDGWGMRPDYTVVLRADGSATYVGRAGVPMLGPYSAPIETEEFRRLAEQAIEIGFFALKDDYPEGPTDQATTITTITANERRKRVRNYGYSGPDELRSFENAVVLAAARLAWRADARTDGQ
jgi:hypothetical protein